MALYKKFSPPQKKKDFDFPLQYVDNYETKRFKIQNFPNYLKIDFYVILAE